ncbi:MAG: M20 family metallopeptidase [Pyrodictiaceae archaeon]
MKEGDYALELLEKLVSIPTENPPGVGYEDIAALLEESLKEIGLEVNVIEIPEDYLDKRYPHAPLHRGRRRLIVYGYTSTGKGGPILHFNGHYDVVPAGQGWSHDPFKPVVEGGKLYGRGSTDMKGGIAAAMAAIAGYLEECRPRGRLEAVFVPDEETGGVGTRYLIESGLTRPNYVVIGEPTPRDGVVVGHRGLLKARVFVEGRQAHASMPWMGRNAFINAARLVLAFIEDYEPRLKRKISSFEAEVGDERARHPTITLGGYAESTSRKENIVPGGFVFSIDRRLIPEEDPWEAKRELEEVFARVATRLGVNARLEVVDLIPPALTPRGSRLINEGLHCVREVVGRARPIVSMIRSDASFYIGMLRAEAINYGPGEPSLAHMADEYVRLERLEETIRVYKCIMRSILGC